MTKKAAISYLLTVTIALALITLPPLTVSAATTHEVGDATALANALTNSASDDTIKLTADITYNGVISISGKTVTLDLNEKNGGRSS